MSCRKPHSRYTSSLQRAEAAEVCLSDGSQTAHRFLEGLPVKGGAESSEDMTSLFFPQKKFRKHAMTGNANFLLCIFTTCSVTN